MAKALNKVARVIGAVATVVGTVASFIPGGQAIAAIAFAVATVAGVVATITAQKPKRQGSSTSFILDPDGPIPYGMGRAATAGRAVARDTWGKDNQYQGFVSVLSGAGPCNSLEAQLIDQAVTTYSSENAVGFYNNFMFSKTQLGAKPSPAFTYTDFPGLDSSFKLSGLCADIWVLKFDTNGKKFTGGVPRRLWVGEWVKVYDPRLDSTYSGGSGSHRIDDESTWTFSKNPWLHELAWEIGRRDNGELVFGTGFPTDKIDLPSYVLAANVADANGWEISGFVDSSMDKWSVSKEIAFVGGGEPIKTIGNISAYVNSPKVSADTVTSDDLVGPCSVPSGQSFQQRINRIIPKYISEAHGWEEVTAGAVSVPAWETEDGGRRTIGQPYRLCNKVDQVAQLAIYQIADSRERVGIVLALKPKWRGYGPGSCLTLNIPEYGLDNVKAVVIDRQEDPATKTAILSFRTEDDAKHPLALAGTGVAPPGVDLTPRNIDDVPEPEDGAWALSGTTIAGQNSEIPALVITGAVDNPEASQVIFEYREDGDTDWISGGVEGADTIRKEIISVKENAAYEVAVSYVVRGVIGARRVLDPETSGTGNLSGVEAGATRNQDQQNLIPNAITYGGYEETSPSNLQLQDLTPTAGPLRDYRRVRGDGNGVNHGFYIHGSSGSDLIPVREGETLYRSFEAFRSSATGQCNLLTSFYKGDGSFISDLFSEAAPADATNGAWLQYQDEVTVPVGAAFMLVRFWMNSSNTSGSVWFLANPYVGRAQLGSDVTADAVPYHGDPEGDFNFTANHLGVLDGDPLPSTNRIRRFKGGVDKSMDSVWTINSQGGVTGGTVTVSNGVVTIPTGCTIPLSGKIEVQSVRDGFTLKSTMDVSRSDAEPPAVPAGGGTRDSDSSLSNISTASLVAVSDVMEFETGPDGDAQFSGDLSIIAAQAANAGDFGARLQWRVATTSGALTGSGSNTGSEISETQKTQVEYDSETDSYFLNLTGSINSALLDNSLTADTTYFAQLWARRDSASPAKVIGLGGSVSVQGS